LSDQVVDDAIYPCQISPRVQANLYRTRVRSVQQQVDVGHQRSMRAKVLLRALQSVRADPHLVYMLLSENRDVAFLGTCTSTNRQKLEPEPEPEQEVACNSDNDNDNDDTTMMLTTRNYALLDTSKRKREGE
jgi:hypothetical protein